MTTMGNKRERNKGAVAAGFLLGSALMAGYAVTKRREYARTGAPKLIDWAKVKNVAQMANKEANEQTWNPQMDEYYTSLVNKSIPLIAEYTKTQLPNPLESVHAVSRNEWVEANISSFQQLFAPIERMHAQMTNPTALSTIMFGGINQNIVSAEMGFMLGFMAKRVLGQYDLSLLGKEPLEKGHLYFVEPNLNAVQEQLGVDGDDFRLWIALHETTHAFEFEAHPWLRLYFNSILETYFNDLGTELQRLSTSGLNVINDIAQRMRENATKKNGESWVEMIMSPAQREMFQRLQGLMSVVEGYSNHIMNVIGKDLLPSYDFIKEKFEDRAKQKSQAEVLFYRLTGLHIKMEQYRLGEIFVAEVVERKGIEFVNKIWEAEVYIPTMKEVREPETWIARITAHEAAHPHLSIVH